MKKVLIVGMFDRPSPKAAREMDLLQRAGVDVEYRKAGSGPTGTTGSVVVVDELAQNGRMPWPTTAYTEPLRPCKD